MRGLGRNGEAVELRPLRPETGRNPILASGMEMGMRVAELSQLCMSPGHR